MKKLTHFQTPLEVSLMIFDLDGTLIDTLQDLTEAVNFALEKLERPLLTSEQVRQYVGEGLTRFLEKALLNPTPSELAEAKKWFHEYYRKHLTTYTKPYPGIQEILDFFSNKKKAVLTNKPLDYTQHILSALNLDHYFDVIMGSSDELPLKPHPDGIHQILKKTQVSADKTIMIGDGETDIMAGKAANVITCAVGYGFRDVEYLLSLEPDFLIENVYELKTIIR